MASMAVMSGFESTLKNAMADVAGHAQVVKRSRFPDDWKELENRIRRGRADIGQLFAFCFH